MSCCTKTSPLSSAAKSIGKNSLHYLHLIPLPLTFVEICLAPNPWLLTFVETCLAPNPCLLTFVEIYLAPAPCRDFLDEPSLEMLAGKFNRFVPRLGTFVGKLRRFVPKLGTKKSNVSFFPGELTFSAGEVSRNSWERGRPRPQSGGRDDRAPRDGTTALPGASSARSRCKVTY